VILFVCVKAITKLFVVVWTLSAPSEMEPFCASRCYQLMKKTKYKEQE